MSPRREVVERVLVTGSTTWVEPVAIESMLETFAQEPVLRGSSLVVLTGMAEGADTIAREWAVARSVNLYAELLEPGECPGPMHRYNEALLRHGPDVVLAFKDDFDVDWASDSCVAGTEHMCRIAARAGVPVCLNGRDELRIDSPSLGSRHTRTVR